MNIHQFNIQDYDYILPKEKIAQYPATERDKSKLLIFRNNLIEEDIFENIHSYIPENSLLIFNDTKVFPSRLIFQKRTGAMIEVFCLEPVFPTNFTDAFAQTKRTKWKCFIGNAKKWKSHKLLKKFNYCGNDYILEAEKQEHFLNTYIIEFSWKLFESSQDLKSTIDGLHKTSRISFGEIINILGKIPLPPYISRNAEDIDKNSYQTVYAKQEGSVASPTAGLHFTKKVFSSLQKKNIKCEHITLHVGPSTFVPVKTNNILEHKMDSEYISVNIETIKNIHKNLDNKIIAVGTTTVRTIESLYWLGVKLLNKEQINLNNFMIGQWEPYSDSGLRNADCEFSTKDVLKIIINEMNEQKITRLQGVTQLIILPDYEFKIISGLITNFHLPRSTLLLLISAFLGGKWKEIYNYALSHNFRFLSYGDCCLFM